MSAAGTACPTHHSCSMRDRFGASRRCCCCCCCCIKCRLVRCLSSLSVCLRARVFVWHDQMHACARPAASFLLPKKSADWAVEEGGGVGQKITETGWPWGGPGPGGGGKRNRDSEASSLQPGPVVRGKEGRERAEGVLENCGGKRNKVRTRKGRWRARGVGQLAKRKRERGGRTSRRGERGKGCDWIEGRIGCGHRVTCVVRRCDTLPHLISTPARARASARARTHAC